MMPIKPFRERKTRPFPKAPKPSNAPYVLGWVLFYVILCIVGFVLGDK